MGFDGLVWWWWWKGILEVEIRGRQRVEGNDRRGAGVALDGGLRKMAWW